ncbi:MAG: orotidine-5'-phosphate decarboxylase [Microbacteriaceae bacterium]
MSAFGDRLRTALDARGQLCVGIDPHPFLLRAWGLGDDAAGLAELGLRVVEACAGRVGVVKPQVAFFERHGAAGYAALEQVLAAARAAGLLVIADVKRGDIGSTVEAYGQAWLSPGSPLEADAMTIVAYQGTGSITAPRDLALASGKGLFVLAATSNPEAAATQRARRADARTVAAGIVAEVRDWNAAAGGGPLGSVGVVVGATLELAGYGFTGADLAGVPVLSPGFGAQGARFEQLRPIFGPAAGQVLLSASRSVLEAGPEGIAEAVRASAAAVREAAAS